MFAALQSAGRSRVTFDRSAIERPLIPLAWLGGAMGASLLVVLALLADAGLHVRVVTVHSLPVLIWLSLTLGAAVAARGGSRLADCALYYGLFSVLALMGAVASYPIAVLSHGYVDGTLQRIDNGLRFDWLAWYELVAAHPALQRLGHVAYQSIYLSPAVLLGWYAAKRRRSDAHAFLAAFWLAAVITLTLFAAMPAQGPFIRDWHGAIRYMPDSALWQPMLISALREGVVHRVDLGALRGLVSAPSFHTAAAVLYIASAWPIARLRWPLLALNGAMLLSTPVEGTHYLADMLMGALVAAVALTAVQALIALRAHADGDALRGPELARR